MPINYQKFIEENFSIKDKSGKVVPFYLFNVQDKYLLDMRTYYGDDLAGVRDIILKGRKEGFSSLVLAMFATDFLLEDYPIASVCIANNKEETKKLLGRAIFFIESALKKKGMTLADICDTSSTTELVNKTNGATFHIGTAGSKTALRVDSVQNLHFSEAAHFQDSADGIITARETIEGALQMVDQGVGKVFVESTANGYGNYFQILEHKAYKAHKLSEGESEFRPLFFGAREVYSEEWLAKKAKGFTTREMFLQEYPITRDDAYMSSGSKFFDGAGIKYLQNMIRPPMQKGYINTYGEMATNYPM